MQGNGPRDDGLIDDAGRRLSLWSHDVLLAVVLTLLAIGYLGVTVTGNGTLQDASIKGLSIAPPTTISSK